MRSLLKYNTFGIDQSCNEIFEPSTVEELKSMLPVLRQAPLLVIGGGSNLLLTKDFDGNVLHPCIKGMDVNTIPDDDSHVFLRCGAGEVWDDVVAYAVDNHYYGIENLSLIPGEVGASAVQNIGAYGVEVKDVIYSVDAVRISTGEQVTFMCNDCDYAYRYSKFKGEWKGQYVVTHVTYRLSHEFMPKIGYGNLEKFLVSDKGNISSITAHDVRDAVISIRQSKLPDPMIEGNAGSFFMNPIVSREKYESLAGIYPDMPHYAVGDMVKIPAGWMIEQCGWKGRTLGKAGVHDKQALVLVNRGGAKGLDILNLCDAIRNDVNERFGIEIKPEVNII